MNAIIFAVMNWYSVFVRSFADSNGDGIGDLQGLIRKLDYLVDLGIEGIWLLPIHPAPSYHKYDVMDYYGIDPEYGTLNDFKKLVIEVHKRGLLLIIDLVVNHTSELHPWFKRALMSKRTVYRNYYVWKDARYIPSDQQEQWHLPQSGIRSEAYYGLFWKGMPDLNFDNERVRRNVIEIARYWLDLGVDGFRIDAAMHIFPPDRNEENILWWQEFRAALDATGKKHFTVGEITESCAFIGPYLNKGLHTCFNFELAEHIIQAVLYERHDCLAGWYQAVQNWYTSESGTVRDAIFLSNHDQTRIATRLKGDSAKIKLAATILCTFPGEIFIYYGEELGMTGDKPDELIREPFLWSGSAGDPSATHWVEAKYSTRKTISPLSQQHDDIHSVFQHYRQLLQFRKAHPWLATATLSTIDCSESSVLIYTLSGEGRQWLIMHNLTGTPTELRKEENHTRFTELFSHASHLISESGSFHLEPYGSLVTEI